MSPFFYVNRNGIPTLESQGVTVTTTDVQFSFRNHRFVGAPYRGLIIIRIGQAVPDVTTTTLPIVFTSEGNAPKALTGFGGSAITVADLPGTGVYLCWYEQQSGTLQLLSGIV